MNLTLRHSDEKTEIHAISGARRYFFSKIIEKSRQMNVRNPVSALQFTTDDLTSYTRRKFY